MENVKSLSPKGTPKKVRNILFGFIDVRDKSILPLQAILFIFATIEVVQAVFYLLHEKIDNVNQHIFSHLGSYMIAYSVALFIVSFRPARARGLLIVITFLALSFIVTSIIDIARGNADAAGEISHVSKLIGPLIIWIIAKRVVYYPSVK